MTSSPSSRDSPAPYAKVRSRQIPVRFGHPGTFSSILDHTAFAVDNIVELNLSKAVNTTNTNFIRASIQERVDAAGLDAPPIELVQFHVFIHCTSGTGRHMVDFVDHEMKRGTAIWVRPGQVQQWSDVHDGFNADVAVFESSSIPDLPLFDRSLGGTNVADLGVDAASLEGQMSWMAEDLAANQDQATAAAVVGVILRLFTRHATKDSDADDTPSRRLAGAFVDSVDQHIDQRSVAWHARRVGASTRSVARATAAVLGQSPKEIIDASVILEAQRRLAWSDQDIATIARALRFSEPSNFTKFFRLRTGMPPSSFRETVTSI